MSPPPRPQHPGPRVPLGGHLPRRHHLAQLGMGFGSLALQWLLHRDASATPSSRTSATHYPAKAQNVIWIFLSGGYSHMETFDPKPALNRYAGLSYAQTPYPNPFDNPDFQSRSRAVVGGDRLHAEIFPMQVGFRRHGQSGIAISDWWPHLSRMADDLTIVRSMYTTDNDHAAEFQFHTGRHKLDPPQPSIGSWIHYGLGAINENLPQFVFLGKYSDMRVKQNFDADYLGPQHAGVELELDGPHPLRYGQPAAGVPLDQQRRQFELLGNLHRLSARAAAPDPQLQARIQAYELAFRMQSSVPEALDFRSESAETLALYGIDQDPTDIYGRRLLAARRLVERGVRFSLVYLSDYGEWDSHQQLKENHSRSCRRVDQPIAGLLQDLKRRGLLDQTLVVFCTEFGRTPALEMRDTIQQPTGRDHHPHAFSIWLAGAGLKPGHVHGATDELGFHVVDSPHYVTDLHATVLHLLGLDSKRLHVPGRQRLEIDDGHPIQDILA